MDTPTTRTMYPLSAALDVAGVKPGKFHRHFYGGVLGKALERDGEFAAQISDPMRGAGVGRGGGRFITLDGAICLAVFFRLLSGGVPSARALRMARAFVFLGETGSGLRAFTADTPRPAGGMFTGSQDTFLAAIAGEPGPDRGDTDGFAFVPGQDLTAPRIMEWLDLQCEDSAPVCLVNLSEVVREMRDGLERNPGSTIQCPAQVDIQGGAESDAACNPVAAFLAEFTVRDPAARTSTREFSRAFGAWLSDWRDGARPHGLGDDESAGPALVDALAALGVRKVKSNGNMMFAGVRWRENPAALAFLAGALALE